MAMQEASDSLNPPEQTLNDVASFSLCSLCAIKLGLLYSESFHTSFRKAYLEKLLKSFHLPSKSIHPMLEFTKDDEFTFLCSIRRNSSLGPLKIIEKLVVISIIDGYYDARSHYLILDVALSFGIPRELVEIHCETIFDLLVSSTKPSDQQTSPENSNGENKKKVKKYLMIGLASIGGGAIIGLTGGLAAPIVASAFAGVIGAGTLVMSPAAVGLVGSLFGVAGAGLTASKMNKRIGDLEEFAFESLNREVEQTSPNITICVSGWVSDESSEQFIRPWKNLRYSKEQYTLRYESKYLYELSQAMDYLLSFVVFNATQQALQYTFLAGLVAAVAWPTALISVSNIIDNPWDVCLKRSLKAGIHLASVLISRCQGKRPVSLIGFSLGARVIYYCLQELSKSDNSEGIIGDVILLGAPVTASHENWSPFSRVVSGTIVNGYSSRDWLLKFLYRASSAEIRVAGLQAIEWNFSRLKNVDLTEIVGGHVDYSKKLNEILSYVGVRTLADHVDDDIVIESEHMMVTSKSCDDIRLSI